MEYIALKMLTADRGKYLGLIFAIAFSTFLLSHQVSMFIGILERTTSQIIDVVDADIWVMDKHTEYIDEISSVTDNALLKVRSAPGVEWAVRFFKGYATAKGKNGRFRQVILLGLDDFTLVGPSRKMVLGSYESLRKPNAIVIDEAGFRHFFPGEPLALGKVLEMNERRAEIVAISDASPPFQTFPVVFTRYANAIDYVGKQRKQMSFAMVKSAKDRPLKDVCREIEAATDLKALTTDEFAWATIAYYLKHTGIPVNFGIVVLVAVLVGAVVAGQTFYIFTLQNLKQFAALKAIGLTNRSLGKMVVVQAAFVGFIGYCFGVAMTAAFFLLTSQVPDLRGFATYWEVILASFATVMGIVLIASAASLRSLLRLEPAMVFRT